MVKLLIGHKGSGKTKKMIDLANDTVQDAKGSIVFINKNTRLIYDLDYKIRVVCMEDFPHITNADEYLGFIFGIMSSDNDIQTMFLDGIMRHRDFALDVLPDFIDKIKIVSKETGIDFIVSVSAELEEMIGVNFDGIEVLN
ncbi:MAG: hypothetical protein KBS56_02490 [Clostridiales bacterium]|nr:hypothetical protein [Candidatus Crickella equi]